MSRSQITPAAQPRPTAARRDATLVSLVAAKAGRDIIWVLIAGAFLFVEAVVFLTELPTARFFHRREAAKTAGFTRT